MASVCGETGRLGTRTMRGAFTAPHSCTHLHFASDSFFVSSPAPGSGRPWPRPRLQSSAPLGSPVHTLRSAAFQTTHTFSISPHTPTEIQGLGGHLRLQQKCERRGWEWNKPVVSTAPVPRAAGLPGEVRNTMALRHALGGKSLLSG